MKRTLLLVAALAAGGCSEVQKIGKTGCSDTDGVALVTKLITDESSKLLGEEKGGDGARLFDNAAIRAQVAAIQLAVADIRTDKTDPNSTKVFCKGTIKLTLPADSMTGTDEALKLLQQGDLSALADRSNMERSANVFSSEIAYTIQPTDDGESIFAEIPEGHSSSEFLRWVVGSQLVAARRQAASASQSIAAAIPETPEPAVMEPPVIEPAPAPAEAASAGEPIRASFPCEQASTPIEKAICGDAELAGMDREVGALFKRALQEYPDTDVRGLQVSWIQDVRDECDSLKCLYEVYADRKNYFESNFSSSQ